MKRPGNILLLALLIGAISAALLYRYLKQQEASLEAARGVASSVVDVVVANETITIGSRLSAERLRVVAWPADSPPQGAFQKPADLVGKTVRNTVERNTPVLLAHLVSEQAGLLPLLISEGMRGISVKVDNVTGVSGFITPNSRVDVVASGAPDSDTREIHSRVVLQNVRVLAVGTAVELQQDKPVEVPTVTLLVSPSDAEKLTLATYDRPVRLALRNYLDEGIVPTTGIAVPALFGGGAPKAGSGSLVQVSSSAGRPAPSVEVVLGDQVSLQSY